MALTESSRDRWPDFPFLEAIFMLGQDEIEVGSSSQGHVNFRNVGNSLIEFQSDQPLLASLLDPKTSERAGGFGGWIAGTGRLIRLGPDEKATIPVLVGTTTGLKDLNLSLPPGEYLVKVDMPLYELRPDHEGYERSYLHLPVVGIRVVKRSHR